MDGAARQAPGGGGRGCQWEPRPRGQLLEAALGDTSAQKPGNLPRVIYVTHTCCYEAGTGPRRRGSLGGGGGAVASVHGRQAAHAFRELFSSHWSPPPGLFASCGPALPAGAPTSCLFSHPQKLLPSGSEGQSGPSVTTQPLGWPHLTVRGPPGVTAALQHAVFDTHHERLL